MAENHLDSSQSQLPDGSSENSFDFKNCEESLPNIDVPKDNLEGSCSDDEYSDANDVCDADFQELDDEALQEKHENLTDEQLEVCLSFSKLNRLLKTFSIYKLKI